MPVCVVMFCIARDEKEEVREDSEIGRHRASDEQRRIQYLMNSRLQYFLFNSPSARPIRNIFRRSSLNYNIISLKNN